MSRVLKIKVLLGRPGGRCIPDRWKQSAEGRTQMITLHVPKEKSQRQFVYSWDIQVKLWSRGAWGTSKTSS